MGTDPQQPVIVDVPSDSGTQTAYNQGSSGPVAVVARLIEAWQDLLALLAALVQGLF